MKRLILLGLFLGIASIPFLLTGCPAVPDTPSIDSGEETLPEIPSEENPADTDPDPTDTDPATS